MATLITKESTQDRDLINVSCGKHISEEHASSEGTEAQNAKLQESRVW